MSTTTTLNAYGGLDVTLDATSLHVHARNRKGRFVLTSTEDVETSLRSGAFGTRDDLIVDYTDVEDVQYKSPTLLANGRVDITVKGRSKPIQVHFLKKHKDEFTLFAMQLTDQMLLSRQSA